MNKWQKVILIAGISVIVLMVFFPPWAFNYTSTLDGSTVRFFAGYEYIFTPPKPKNTWTSAGIYFRGLIFQCALVAIITGGIIERLKSKKKE